MRTIIIIMVLVLVSVAVLFKESRTMHQAQHSWSKTVHKMSSHSPLVDQLKTMKSKPIARGSFPNAKTPPQKELLAVHWKKPTRSFFITHRTPHIKRYPCGGCHDGSMKKSKTSTRFRSTHGDIALKHASQGVLQCKSCHYDKDMNKLRTPAGAVLSMNKSYLLCASCHTRQANDWAGGAHGKRTKFWAGTRVVRTCTGCHNPHKPLFGKRWPKTHYRPPKSKRKH